MVVQTVLISTVLGIVKIVAGWIGHSYALIADGIESVLDVFGSMVVWGGLHIASRPPDENHPYGHGKAEPLAALVVCTALFAAAIGLAIQSVREIGSPHHAPERFTLWVLIAVVIVKELIFRRLSAVGREIDSLSLRADAWHHRVDALTSAAAFVGISVALIGGPGYESADDWAALAVCVLIAGNAIRLFRGAIDEVMDVAAPDHVLAAIRRTASDVPGVTDVEKCFARKSGPGWLVDIHVEIDGTRSIAAGHEIGHAVKRALRDAPLGVLDVLVHIEPAPTD